MNGNAVMVTMSDCQKAGFCPSGIHSWMKSNGLDTRILIRDGYPIGVIESIGDAFGLKAVENARRRVSDEQQ